MTKPLTIDIAAPNRYELTEEQVKLLVESLRHNERSARNNFGLWFMKNIDALGTEEWTKRQVKAEKLFKDFAELRALFFDDKPVLADYRDAQRKKD